MRVSESELRQELKNVQQTDWVQLRVICSCSAADPVDLGPLGLRNTSDYIIIPSYVNYHDIPLYCPYSN